MFGEEFASGTKQGMESDIFLSDRLRVASHEIKNPIAALLLNFNIAARHKNSGPLTQHQLHNLVRRIKDLTEFFFDSGYLETGRIKARFEFADLNQIIDDLAKQHQLIASHSGVSLTFRFQDYIVGQFDRQLIEQLMANLVSNAIKYGKKKPVEIATSVLDSDEVVITVKDQGEGISPSIMDRIFEFGSRDKCIAKVYDGQGLGLWITHQIVDALGGYILVSSKLGVGSCFSVHLPLRPMEKKTAPTTLIRLDERKSQFADAVVNR